MFTITWIQRHQEMTALFAAGVSRVRVLRPVLIAADRCQPVRGRQSRVRHAQHPRTSGERLKKSRRRTRADDAIAIRQRNRHPLGGEKIVAATRTIVEPSFVLPREFDQFGRQLNGREARFLPAKDGQPKRLSTFRRYVARRLCSKSPALLQGDKADHHHTDRQQLARRDQVFVVSGVSFEFLSAGANWRDFASTHEMIQQLRSPSTDLGADVRVAIHSRFLQPLLDTTLLFLGLPFVVTRTNRNPFIAIGLCLGRGNGLHARRTSALNHWALKACFQRRSRPGYPSCSSLRSRCAMSTRCISNHWR